MKLTTKRLKQLIKEELSNVLEEERSEQDLVRLIQQLEDGIGGPMDVNPEITQQQLDKAKADLMKLRASKPASKGFDSGAYDEMEKMIHGRNANRPMEE